MEKINKIDKTTSDKINNIIEEKIIDAISSSIQCDECDLDQDIIDIFQDPNVFLNMGQHDEEGKEIANADMMPSFNFQLIDIRDLQMKINVNLFIKIVRMTSILYKKIEDHQKLMIENGADLNELNIENAYEILEVALKLNEKFRDIVLKKLNNNNDKPSIDFENSKYILNISYTAGR
jgi:hypothetical protein